ncbi:uncharacterized protein AB9X84_018718 [Acanthopagrus schlegelii]
MKRSLSLVILVLLGLVALCVAQDPTSPVTKPSEKPQVTTPSANTNQSENTTQTEATPPSANTGQTEPTPTAEKITDPAVNGTQKPPVDPTVGVNDPGLTDGAIAGIAIGSIAGVAAVGGGVFGILKKFGKI